MSSSEGNPARSKMDQSLDEIMSGSRRGGSSNYGGNRQHYNQHIHEDYDESSGQRSYYTSNYNKQRDQPRQLYTKNYNQNRGNNRYNNNNYRKWTNNYDDEYKRFKRGASSDSDDSDKPASNTPMYDFESPVNVTMPAPSDFNSIGAGVAPSIPLDQFLAEKASQKPNPEAELIRKNFVVELRLKHEDLCTKVVGIAPPKDSFNRWLFERKLRPGCGDDPLLVRLAEPRVSPSLKRELLEDIPIKIKYPRDARTARQGLMSYITEATRLANNDNLGQRLTDEERDAVAKATDKAKRWANSSRYASVEENVAALNEMKKVCSSIFHRKMLPVVERVCIELGEYSDKLAKEAEEQIAKLDESKTKAVAVQRLSDTTVALLYKEESLLINATHFEKLHKLYQINKRRRRRRLEHAQANNNNNNSTTTTTNTITATVADNSSSSSSSAIESTTTTTDQEQDKVIVPPDEDQEFLTRLFCLVRRYETFFGMCQFEGTGFQAALPENVFKTLTDLFDVTFECFASPLNCYFSHFCSAFPDTDTEFGSCGSFLNFQPTGGSFEANPPFTEEVMEAMVDHMEHLLEHATEPMSFAIFIPEWLDPPMAALERLQKSKFLRGDFVSTEKAHRYVNGAQHSVGKSQRHYVAVHGTHVLFMQNDAGKAKWEPTQEKMNKLRAAMEDVSRG